MTKDVDFVALIEAYREGDESARARLVDTVQEVPADGGEGAWIELGIRVARRDGV